MNEYNKYKYCFKKNARIVEEDAGIIFYYLGNSYLFKGERIKFLLKKVFVNLQKPQTVEEIYRILGDTITIEETECMIMSLLKKHLVYKVTEDSKKIDGSFKSINKYMYNFVDDNQTINQLVSNFINRKISIIDYTNNGRIVLDTISKYNVSSLVYMNNDLISDCKLENYTTTQNNSHLSFKEINYKLLDVDDIVLVISPWYNEKECLKINQHVKKNSINCLFVFIDEFGGTLGPFLGHHDGPCLNCLYARKRNNMLNIDKYDLIQKTMSQQILKEQGEMFFFPHVSIIMNIAILEILKHITEYSLPLTHGGIYEFDLVNYRMEYHNLLPYYDCKVCQ